MRPSFLRRDFRSIVALVILSIFSVDISQAQTDSTKKVDSAQTEKLQGEKKVNPFNQMEPDGHSPSEAEVKALFTKIVRNPPPDRIYFINGSKATIEKIKKLKFEITTDMQLLPPEDAMKKFGVTGEKGVIAFLTKK